MKEQRKAQRFEEENEVTITVISDKGNLPKEGITNTYSMDISVSGTKIKTNILLPVDTLLKIDFTLETLQQKINAIGKVKWIKIIVDGESYEEGVEFVAPLRKLADYIVGKQKAQSHTSS
jgi:hypothetical protein